MGDPGKDFATGKGFGGMAAEMKTAMESGISPDTTIQILTSIEKQINDIQKGLTDGVVVGAAKFRERLTEVYQDTQKIGASFKDVTDLASGVGTSLGKAITPSLLTLTNMVEFGKATGIANAEITNTIATFVKLGQTQSESLKIMNDITLEARKSGLDALEIIKDVTTNLDKVAVMGFSDGIDGLSKMATEAKSLNTNVKEIGAIKLAESLMDPKNAVELSQKMQMLGGNVGKLGDSFELMRMGAYDVEELQESMLDAVEASFQLNEETGKFEVAGGYVGRQNFKAMTEAMGTQQEVAAKIGQERAKQSFIEEEISSKMKGQFTDEQLTLIKTLSQVGAGKKIEISLPGFENVTDFANMSGVQIAQFKASLIEYQAKAKLSDRELAEKNLTVTESQEIAVQQIKETLMRQLTATEREDVLKAATAVKSGAQTGYSDVTKEVIEQTGMKTLVTTSADFMSRLLNQIGQERPGPGDINKFQNATGTTQYTNFTAEDYLKTENTFDNSNLITGEKGAIQKIIFDKEDDFLAAPKLNEILNKAKISFDAVYALNEMSLKPIPEKVSPIGETFSKIETTVNTNNTNQIKFEPLVIRIEGVDGDLRQMLEKGANASLLSEKIVEQFSKMPKLMESKGVFG
jgi:hypothetical protein